MVEVDEAMVVEVAYEVQPDQDLQVQTLVVAENKVEGVSLVEQGATKW